MAVHGGSNDAALPNIAADDVAGVKYQVVKLDLGAAGVSAPVSGAIPVSQPGLSGGLVHDVIAVGASAVLIPAVPDPARVGILVANTGTTTLYFGNSNVAVGNVSHGAPPLAPGTERFYAIGAAVLLYAIGSAAGGYCAYTEIKVA